MNNRAQESLDHKVPNLINIGDSRLAIQQSLGDRIQEKLDAGDASASQIISRPAQICPVFRHNTVLRRGSSTLATEALEAK